MYSVGVETPTERRSFSASSSPPKEQNHDGEKNDGKSGTRQDAQG